MREDETSNRTTEPDMRIGIEARRLTGTRGGLNVYTRCLVTELCGLGHEVRLISDVPPPADDLPATAVRIPSHLGPLRFRTLWDRRLLPAACGRMGLDVLHFPVGLVTTRLKTCPQVGTIHDLLPLVVPGYMSDERMRRMRKGLTAAVRRYDAIITVSEQTRGDVIRLLDANEERVVTIPLAARECFRRLTLQEDIVSQRRSLGLPDRYALCVVGGGAVHKNMHRAVEALHALGRRMPDDLSLVVVGRENNQVRLARSRAVELGILDRLLFTGVVDDERLCLIYNLASVFVFPSINEGYGLPIIEAMACGVPVIAGDRGAMKEVAGDAAVLVDPNDPEEISDAMARLLTDEAARDDFSSRGITRAAQFSWRKTAERTAEVYAMVSA